MGLLTLLSKSRFGLGGKTPSTLAQSLPTSTLHNTYSLNGSPNLANEPRPSRLDLQGQTPKQYINNLPQ
jgi:hypothetical protein